MTSKVKAELHFFLDEAYFTDLTLTQGGLPVFLLPLNRSCSWVKGLLKVIYLIVNSFLINGFLKCK